MRPINFPGVFWRPLGTPKNPRNIPEPFWCPNITFQYINLYLPTISRLLVMSVISSGTSNNIRSPNHITHIILYHQRTLSVWTIPVRELCRHDQDTFWVNNQKRNLDAHIGSYIFYEDLYQFNIYDNTSSSLRLSVCYLHYKKRHIRDILGRTKIFSVILMTHL